MNPNRSRSPTALEPNFYSPELGEFLQQKRLNFTGRNFVFDAIKQFINRYSRGYFTLVGYPGMGKTAILVQLLNLYPDLIFTTTELDPNFSDRTLETLCHQLINRYQLTDIPLLEDSPQGGWLFSIILQKISEKLSPEQRLIIAIDGVDRIDITRQTVGSNLLYLPRYLPEKVYFILSRRPYLKIKSGLLTETPSQILDLSNYYSENQQDIQAYLQLFIHNPSFQESLNQWQIQPELGLESLKINSENNFKYVSEWIAFLTSDLSSFSPLQEHSETANLFQYITPSPLTAYYQSLWQQMTAGNPTELQLKIIAGLSQNQQGITLEAIAQQFNEDEYDIELILENWIEFLQIEMINDEIYYRFYHSHFRDFFKKRDLS